MIRSSNGLANFTFIRWTSAIACGFAIMALALFAFIYWQTTASEQARVDGIIVGEIAVLERLSSEDAAREMTSWLATDLHGLIYTGLFDADGHQLAGNLLKMPRGLVQDGRPHQAVFGPIDRPRDGAHPEIVRGASVRLRSGTTVAIGYDIDELVEFDRTIRRALALGTVPMLLFSVAGGVVLSVRGQHRINQVHQSVQRIMQGELRERLPVRRAGDELDKVSASVNQMLDEIEGLVEEIRGVGDAIAHDVRTPLTRVRTRLERCRDEAVTVEDFQVATDRAIVSLDQALAIVAAILRIGEIQHGVRRAAFAPLRLGELLHDVAELYLPVAEEKAIELRVLANCDPVISGDRDLLLEAVGNIVENAIKFSPCGGDVLLATEAHYGCAKLTVTDRGPGIPPSERERVFRRFYRTDQSRTVNGCGLGLSLVAAIMHLHGYKLTVGDANPGCLIEVTVPVASGEFRFPPAAAAAGNVRARDVDRHGGRSMQGQRAL